MKRVVITGVGCVSALGLDAQRFTRNLMLGSCGIGPISRFDASGFRVQVAAEIRDYDEAAHFDAPRAARLDRFSQLAVVSAREAARDARLLLRTRRNRRTAVVHGTSVGGQETQDGAYHRIYGEGSTRLHPMTVPRLMPSAAVSQIGVDLGITGPSFGIASACASGAHAIAIGAMMLRSGLVDVAMVGGSEACITPGTFRGWESLRVMASDTCRPFSRGRGGMVIGEGAATLVLETLEHALSRGAHIRAELCGIGMSAGAEDHLQPTTDGMAAAMSAAVIDAGLLPEEVDYINAHGSGTAHCDPAETKAIKEVFGQHALKMAVSSTKSMVGHLLGASPALEAVATVAAIEAGQAPPTIGYLGSDPECDLDYVPNSSRRMPIRFALSNSFGFGGLNASLAFRRYEAAA